jgi:hypothetical protein
MIKKIVRNGRVYVVDVDKARGAMKYAMEVRQKRREQEGKQT